MQSSVTQTGATNFYSSFSKGKGFYNIFCSGSASNNNININISGIPGYRYLDINLQSMQNDYQPATFSGIILNSMESYPPTGYYTHKCDFKKIFVPINQITLYNVYNFSLSITAYV